MYIPPQMTGELGSTTALVARNSQCRSAPYCDNIDGILIDALTNAYGSPLFVYSQKTIEKTARRAKKAFADAYRGKTIFGWSYKTNYLGAICNIFHREGWIAEVVSDFEYKKALKSVPGNQIIYNGPHKSPESLMQAIKDQAIIQIDNWDELEMIETLTEHMDRVARVGIRTWMDTKLAPVWSKFGFSLQNGEALRAALRIVANPRLDLRTLHSHIGTFVLDPKAYAVAVNRLLSLRALIAVETDHIVPCINLGGGFPSQSLMHEMPDNYQVKPIEAYAKTIGNVLNKCENKPVLFLETGRHLIDEAGYLITSVVTVKSADREPHKAAYGKSARGAYIVDTGVHNLYTSTWFKIGVMPTKQSRAEHTDTVKLYGCLCMNIDVIRDSVELPPMEVGDRLVLHPVGAYNLTQSMQFIGLRPAVVLIHGDDVSLIREREELSDLDRAEKMPHHLER